MQEVTVPLLATWENFYVIVGSAAAALTGLTFVVITLVAGLQDTRIRTSDTLGAFSTPTVVHFCAVLLIAGMLSAPWPGLWYPGLLLGLTGLAGVLYIVIVMRRATHQTQYKLVLEDWLWHITFPFISYAALFIAALLLIGNPMQALFVVAAVTLLLLFTGIHNSWDTVTYLVIERLQSQNRGQGGQGEPGGQGAQEGQGEQREQDRQSSVAE